TGANFLGAQKPDRAISEGPGHLTLPDREQTRRGAKVEHDLRDRGCRKTRLAKIIPRQDFKRRSGLDYVNNTLLIRTIDLAIRRNKGRGARRVLPKALLIHLAAS